MHENKPVQTPNASHARSDGAEQGTGGGANRLNSLERGALILSIVVVVLALVALLIFR